MEIYGDNAILNIGHRKRYLERIWHTFIKIYLNYLHVRKWLASLEMIRFDFVNLIFCGTFGL